MKEIPLTQGKVALVDDADYDWLEQWKWFAHLNRKNGVWYACRSSGPRAARVCWEMHRLIMGTPKGMETDHIDHDGLHNWRANLRICTRAQNHQNERLSANNRSGYKGVSWSKRDQRWEVKIKSGEKQYRLGYFGILEEAARAYDDAATRLFGDFACLNDISMPFIPTDNP